MSPSLRTVSPALPVDDDVSSSVTYITDDTLSLDGPVEPTDALLNSQSVVLSLDQDTTGNPSRRPVEI